MTVSKNRVSCHSKLVGVSHDGRQDVIASMSLHDRLRFRREPDNPHDKQAVAVDAAIATSESGYGGDEGDLDQEWKHIGYIAADKNAELAKLLDEGKEASIKISDITGGGSKNYGVNVYIEHERERKLVRTPDAELVKDIFGNSIYYDDTVHQYTNAMGEVYLSGSKYADQFSKPFASEYISNAMAKKAGLSRAHARKIEDMWRLKADASAALGTGIHAALELYGVYKELCDSLGKETHIHDNPVLNHAVVTFYEEHPDTTAVEYEALVVDHNKKRAGRIDRLEFEPDGSVWIADFKGLAVDTPIPTPSGFVAMGDLQVGDLVFGRDGKQYPVINKSSVHHKKCYQIDFSNGESVVADYDHRWVVAGGSAYFDDMEDVIKTTDQLTNKDRIILAQPTENSTRELTIDPYVLGLWLADGNRAAGTITCVSSAIWDEVKSRGYEISDNHNRNYDKAESRTVYGIFKHLRELGLIGNKHIPDVYITSSYEQRLDLLRGYFDGDGYWNRARKRFVMNTTSEAQADDIVKLVSSLGVQASKAAHKVSGFGLEKTGWYVSFAPIIDPFLVRKSDATIVNRTKKSHIVYIKNVEGVDTVPTQCIEVGSPDHTYLFGYHHTVTHNTNSDIEKKLNSYWLQLSFYAAILKANGVKVNGLKIYHYNGGDWRTIEHEVIEIDLKLQPEVLMHPNIPKPLHEVNPRNIMGKEKWDEVRQEVYASTDYHCIACGVHKNNAKGPKWLEAHEFYNIDYAKGRVEIEKIIPLCHYCHNFIHSGRLQMVIGKDKTREEVIDILSHGFKVLSDAKLPAFHHTVELAEELGVDTLGVKSEGLNSGPTAAWADWRLVWEGKEYSPKYKTYEEWKERYSK